MGNGMAAVASGGAAPGVHMAGVGVPGILMHVVDAGLDLADRVEVLVQLGPVGLAQPLPEGIGPRVRTRSRMLFW